MDDIGQHDSIQDLWTAEAVRNMLLSAFNEIKNIFYWFDGDAFKGQAQNMGWTWHFEELTKRLVKEGFTIERYLIIARLHHTQPHMRNAFLLCQLPKFLEEYKIHPKRSRKDDRGYQLLLIQIASWMKFVRRVKRSETG